MSSSRILLGLAACLLTLHSTSAFNVSSSNATVVTGSSCDEGDNCWDFRLQNVQVLILSPPLPYALSPVTPFN